VSTKKKTTEHSTTVNTPTNPQWVTNGLQDQMARLGGLAAADPYSFVAGPSPLQTLGFGVAGGLGAYAPGWFDQAASTAQGVAAYQPQGLSAQAVDPAQAFASFGAADPTAALARSLSGSVDNPYLAAVNQANINQAMQGYNDALGAATRTLTREALPAVRSGAMLAGQYGGSRQGIAEGLALSDVGLQAAQNARNLAQSALDSGNQLYGGAYENAQNRMAAAAQALAALGVQTASANADRTLQADSTSAANGLEGARLNLAGGQALGGLGQAGLGAVGDFGTAQQQLDALYRRAPLDLLHAASGMYGQLPLNLFSGQTQTRDGVVTEKTGGIGPAGSLASDLARSLAALRVKLP